MADIGIQLQKARERLGYDYDYIYQETKIHPRVLKALEEEDFDYFKSPIYIKSFLQKYARFLGLDSSEALADLESVFLRFDKKEQRRIPVTSPSLLSPLDKVFFLFKILFYFLLVVFSIYFVFTGVNKVVSLFLPDKTSILEQSGIPKEEVNLPQQLQQEIALKKVLPEKAVQPLELMIEIQGDCWIRLRSDGEKIFEGVLKKGRREAWKADKEFELWVGNASALKLFLNGAPLGPVGRGVVKSIKITSQGLRLP